MAALYEGTNYTFADEKYKIKIITTLQPSIKILNKCSYFSEDIKQVPSLLLLVVIWFPYNLKCVFLWKSHDNPLFFSESWFGFPTLVRTQATAVLHPSPPPLPFPTIRHGRVSTTNIISFSFLQSFGKVANCELV